MRVTVWCNPVWQILKTRTQKAALKNQLVDQIQFTHRWQQIYSSLLKALLAFLNEVIGVVEDVWLAIFFKNSQLLKNLLLFFKIQFNITLFSLIVSVVCSLNSFVVCSCFKKKNLKYDEQAELFRNGIWHYPQLWKGLCQERWKSPSFENANFHILSLLIIWM